MSYSQQPQPQWQNNPTFQNAPDPSLVGKPIIRTDFMTYNLIMNKSKYIPEDIREEYLK